MSTFLQPKTGLISVVLMLTLITYCGLISFTSDNESNSKSNSRNAHTIEKASAEKTVATTWQWEDLSNTHNEKKSSVFSEEAVYNALQRVRLDKQDNVIIDHEALIALNETLNDSRLQLDDQALAELQMIITQGLPGNAGDDVAKIVADYYHYLAASKEFEALYETVNYQEHYRELIALREQHLGSDTASKLFATSNANANYMFDMLAIEQDTQLAEEEKQQRYNDIINRHAEQTIAINNWNQRHSHFKIAKKNILNAAINNEEKRTQLTELLHQHFNNEELAHVRHLQLESPILSFGIE